MTNEEASTFIEQAEIAIMRVIDERLLSIRDLPIPERIRLTAKLFIELSKRTGERLFAMQQDMKQELITRFGGKR